MDKITEQDLANRGVKGLPDVPGLTTEEMQRKLEEIAREILIPKVNELVEGLNNANSNLKLVEDALPSIKLISHRWYGTVISGQTVDFGSFQDSIPSGYSFVGMFLTPKATVHISMSYYDYNIFAYSENFTGKIYYDALLMLQKV